VAARDMRFITRAEVLSWKWAEIRATPPAAWRDCAGGAVKRWRCAQPQARAWVEAARRPRPSAPSRAGADPFQTGAEAAPAPLAYRAVLKHKSTCGIYIEN